MGLMDKFKNLFTDEEVIEEEEIDPIEIKEIKKEEEVHQLPTFMREKIEREELEKKSMPSFQEKIRKNELDVSELRLDSNDQAMEELPAIKKVEDKKTFKFPIDLTDNDFVETRSRQSIHARERNDLQVREEKHPEVEMRKRELPSKKEPKSKVAELYKDKKQESVESKKFRATPIISPIYGVLDKNYTPVEVESNKGENLEHHRHSKSVDFDSVRKKAYGSLSEEIKENLMCENCEYLKEAKECKKEKIRKEKNYDNLVYDVLEDCPKNDSYSRSDVRDVTLDEATENYYDYGVAYEKMPVEEDIKIVNHEVEEEVYLPKKEIPPVKSSINLLSTLKKSMGDVVEDPTPKKTEKNLELTDDLFNLIDSMYDERNDS